jgi:hypothetical protein
VAPVRDDVINPSSLEGCQIAGCTVIEVDGKEVPVLVPITVLNVEDMPVVLGPKIGSNTSLAVSSDDPIVFRADCPNPDVQDTVVRRGIVRTGLPKRTSRGISKGCSAMSMRRERRPAGALGRADEVILSGLDEMQRPGHRRREPLAMIARGFP